jgi:hypothetical protein
LSAVLRPESTCNLHRLMFAAVPGHAFDYASRFCRGPESTEDG